MSQDPSFSDERANLRRLFAEVFDKGHAARDLSPAQVRHQRRLAVQSAMLKAERYV